MTVPVLQLPVTNLVIDVNNADSCLDQPACEQQALTQGVPSETVAHRRALAREIDRFPVTDLAGRLDDGSLMDLAALMKTLDIVITVDTAIAHLAGALAVPVWVALPFFPDWRWLLAREDSPWYPSMRLFRQPSYAAWTPVFERMAAELERLYQPDASARAGVSLAKPLHVPR